MRDIKFRAWDKKKGEMIAELHSINFSNQTISGGFPVVGSMDYPFERIELMQFTGLEDRNGVEIYEGDIVKYISKAGFPEDFFETVSVVEFVESPRSQVEGMGCLKPFFDYFDSQDFSWMRDEFEVIGNRWENPELLEEK